MKQKLMEKISLGEKDLIDVTFLCGWYNSQNKYHHKFYSVKDIYF
jgi:hypothetical protein